MGLGKGTPHPPARPQMSLSRPERTLLGQLCPPVAAQCPRDRIPAQWLRAEDLRGLLPNPCNSHPLVSLSRSQVHCYSLGWDHLLHPSPQLSFKSTCDVTYPWRHVWTPRLGLRPSLPAPPNKLATSMISLIPLFQCCLSPEVDLTPHLLTSFSLAPHHLWDKMTAPWAGPQGLACSVPVILLSDNFCASTPAPCPHARDPRKLPPSCPSDSVKVSPPLCR